MEPTPRLATSHNLLYSYLHPAGDLIENLKNIKFLFLH